MLLAGSLMAFGCGDDDPVTDSGTDTGTPTDAGGDSATDGGGDDCPDPGDYHTGVDHCTNAADLEAAMRSDYGDDMDMSAADLAATCARSCLADPDFGTCVTTCIVTGTEGAMSATCAACYTGATGCGAELCLAECLDPANMAGCDACRAGMNSCSFDCGAEFDNCSGLGGAPPADAGTDAGDTDAGAGDAGTDAAPADAAADAT